MKDVETKWNRPFSAALRPGNR